MSPTVQRTGSIALGIAVGLAIALVNSPSAADRSDAYWRSLAYVGIWVDQYDTLENFVRDSDLVVVGRITTAKPGRIVGDPTIGNASYYVENHLIIDRVIFDRSPETPSPTSVTVETESFEADNVAAMIEGFPAERAVYFLRHNSETARRAGHDRTRIDAEEPFWHIVNPEGVFRDLPGGTRLVAAQSSFIVPLADMPFEDVVETLEGVAQRPSP